MKARCYISLQMDVAQDLIYITSHSLRKKCLDGKLFCRNVGKHGPE